MTIAAYAHRVQRQLVATTILKALALAASIVLVVLALSAFFNLSSSVAAAIVSVGAASVLVLLVWRTRTVQSLTNVALWLEETVPAHYAIVTSVGRDHPLPELEQSVRIGTVQPFVTRRLTKVLVRSAAMLLAASLIYLVSPATSLGRGRVHAGLVRAFPGAVVPVNKVATIRIRVTPPAYSRLAVSDQANVASVSVLAGSRIVVSGRGSPEGVAVTLDDMRVSTTGGDDNWSATIHASKPVSVIRATHTGQSRVIILEATPDKPPQVILTTPLHDTTLRTPQFSVILRAETSDDFGLTHGYFEYLIVSGAGEAFSGRTLASSPTRFDSRTGRLQALLDLASLRIVAGDLVSVRAIVRDNNTLTGPSVGTSDTRTFRVARADEYDSVSIEAAAPPPVDSSAMSQRMLIIMTEALVRKQKTLTRKQLVNESDDIATLEDRIRKRVYDILYQTDSPEGVGDTEEAESEIQAISNLDLKQAYDALWDAVRSLRIAEPAVALPPMRVALRALDRARLAKRLYLRGAAPRVVIDIPRVRLTGKEKGASSIRLPQAAADSARRILLAGFESAAAIRRTNPQLAIERLSLLRVRALTTAPEFASALREVIGALEKKRDAEAALIHARKTLTAPAPPASFTSDWGGG